jgi:hypothetical protein
MRIGPLALAVLWSVPLRAQTTTPDPAGVLNRFAFARFLGSGKQSIQAMTSDLAGNVYVAGATSSTDFPVQNAAQAMLGEAVLMRSRNSGVSWGKVPFPTFSMITVTPHPSDPQTLFGGAADGIYKTSNAGATWRKVYSWVNPASHDQVYIVADPANPANVYFYAALDVLGVSNSRAQLFGSSADGGESWTLRSAPSIRPYTIVGAPALWVDANGCATILVQISSSAMQA